MAATSVVVMGGGVAGLSVALLLARDGHRVTVIERDVVEVGAPGDAPKWPRKGVAHFLQPHAFMPRGRAEMREHLGDVYAALLAAGARDIDLRPKLPGPIRPTDEELQFLAVRRPVIEWGLRRAVADEPRIEVRSGARVTGLRIDDRRVIAVEVDGSDVAVDVAVDALGRRSSTVDWLAASGIAAPPAETSDCGVVYYSRYYRLRDDFELPDGPWLLGPRGDLGFLGFTTFPGDNRTFAALLAVPTGVPEWRVLKNADAFEAAVARIPALCAWVNPEGVEPITDVVPMAGLRNELRPYDPTSVAGFVPVGDARCHTDPVLALGLSFALVHAAELTSALREHADVRDACGAFAARASAAGRERYDLATALDEQRHRMWIGGPVDFTRHDGDYALFTTVAGGAAAAVDPEVFRVIVRRMGLLDSTAVLDDDIELQRRIELLFQRMTATPGPPAGPPHDELLAIAQAAVAV